MLRKYFIKSTFDIPPTTLKISLDNPLLEGMEILHISDLHINKKTTIQEIQTLIKKLNTIECDLLIISGDIIDTHIQHLLYKLLLFKRLIHPTYYVSGNHDLVYGYHQLYSVMQMCGITCLDNSSTFVSYKNKHIMLIGLSDRFSKFFNVKRQEKQLIQTVKKNQNAKIFVAHQPKDYKYALQAHCDLFLCGHTHGGQIYPFGYFVRLFQPFVQGLHKVQSLTIYVNKGLGAWGIKYRFFASDELTLLKIVGKN